VPSFQEQTHHVEFWRALPGMERLPSDEDRHARVALTFDDGPDPDATEAVLAALDELGARATFFLVGEQLLDHGELGRELLRRGHGIGLHCFRHLAMGELGKEETRKDLSQGLDAIESATGERPTLFRPTYGWLGEESYAAARELGLEIVYWSAWGMDWEPLPTERIVDLVERDLESGTIVLLHDSPRYAPRPSALPTAQALPAIAEACARRGLELVKLE
jgi:peptidoglycan/xylan/chitin deacetylase (PgdA/CDA1 family)